VPPGAARAAFATADAPPTTSTSLDIAPASASRYVLRASSGSSGSNRLAALRNRRPASPPRRCSNAIWPRKRSTRARASSSSAAASIPANSPSAASRAPASRFAPAAASTRCARCVGSGVRAAARSRNAATAANPPRASARPADRSSCAATSSSGIDAACARCQARRSGSISGSVACPSAR